MAKTSAGSSAVFRAAFLVITLAFILLIVGFTTPNWTEIKKDIHGSRTGLWKTCTQASGAEEKCGESKYDNESWFVIVRTFLTLGVACFIIVLLISLVLLFAVSNQRLARVNIYTGVFTVLFLTIGAATYTYKTDFEQLGYSCWLCWLSVGALLVAIILLEYARRKANRREMTLTRVDIDSGDQSCQMQEFTSNTTHPNQPLVLHQSDQTHGHPVSPEPEKNILDKQ